MKRRVGLQGCSWTSATQAAFSLAAILALLTVAAAADDFSPSTPRAEAARDGQSQFAVRFVQPPVLDAPAAEEPPAIPMPDDPDESADDELLPDPFAELESLLQQPVVLDEPVVTTVSRVEEPVSESPGSVYSFPRDLIIKRGYRSLAELLRVVPGFTVFHRDLQFVAGVRGLNANDNEKITLLINGLNLSGVNEPEFLNGPINLDNVDRVEVVVGPSSFFQQANTLAATINVITKDVDGTELIGATGNDLPYSGTVMIGRRWAEDDTLSLSVTTEKKDGFDAWDPAFRPNLAGTKQTGELEQPNYFAVLRRRYGEWTAQAVAYRTVLPELLINNSDRQNDAQLIDEFYSVSLENEHAVTDALTTVGRFSTTYKQQRRMNQGGRPDEGLELAVTQMRYFGELGIRYTGWDRHLIQAGVQGTCEDNFNSYYTLEHIKTTLIDEDTQALGFYLDDEFQVSERLKLIGGVRQDRNNIIPGDEWYTGIRGAIVLKTTDHWVTKATYNRAVRMPSPLAALNRAWGDDKPNAPDWAMLSPNAHDPEILSTVELHNIFRLGDVRIGTTVFHESLQDFISWFGPHSNVGDFRGTGVELNLEAPLDCCTTLWGNTTYVNSKLQPFAELAPPAGDTAFEGHHVVVDDKGRIVGSPEWTARLGVDRRITDNLNFSPTLRYFTEQAGFASDGTAGEFVTIRNQFYFDASLTWYDIWGRNMDFRLSGYNLLNNRHAVAGQWLRDTYRPRGATVVGTLYCRF